MNDIYTIDYIKQNIITLTDNSIYRVNDSLKLSFDHKINREIMNNTLFKNTILQDFLKILNCKYPDCRTIPQKYCILFDVIMYYIKHNKIPKYDETHLVVHIRMGDVISNMNSINNKINKHIETNPNIKKIVIITAFHFGQPVVSNKIYKSGKYSYTEDKLQNNLKILHDFIHNMSIPVIIESSENIDHDLSILTISHNLITSQGGFSKLVSYLNKSYKYYIKTGITPFKLNDKKHFNNI